MTDKIDTSPEQLIKNAKRGGYAQPNGRLVMVLTDEAERLSARVTELEQRNEKLGEAVGYATQRFTEAEAKLAKVVAIAEVLSGCVEYDYHGNVCGEEEAKAIEALEELNKE